MSVHALDGSNKRTATRFFALDSGIKREAKTGWLLDDSGIKRQVFDASFEESIIVNTAGTYTIPAQAIPGTFSVSGNGLRGGFQSGGSGAGGGGGASRWRSFFGLQFVVAAGGSGGTIGRDPNEPTFQAVPETLFSPGMSFEVELGALQSAPSGSIGGVGDDDNGAGCGTSTGSTGGSAPIPNVGNPSYIRSSPGGTILFTAPSASGTGPLRTGQAGNSITNDCATARGGQGGTGANLPSSQGLGGETSNQFFTVVDGGRGGNQQGNSAAGGTGGNARTDNFGGGDTSSASPGGNGATASTSLSATGTVNFTITFRRYP